MAYINLNNTIERHELTKVLTSKVNEILRNFSTVEEKGRLIGGVAFGHITNLVIPEEIDKVLKNFLKEEI